MYNLLLALANMLNWCGNFLFSHCLFHQKLMPSYKLLIAYMLYILVSDFWLTAFHVWLVFLFIQQFFFKSQVIATNKFKIGKCEDFVWVTKDELLEYFPEQAEFLNKMIISWFRSQINHPCGFNVSILQSILAIHFIVWILMVRRNN